MGKDLGKELYLQSQGDLSSILSQTFQHGCCMVTHALACDSHSLLLSKPENSVAPRVNFSRIMS